MRRLLILEVLFKPILLHCNSIPTLSTSFSLYLLGLIGIEFGSQCPGGFGGRGGWGGGFPGFDLALSVGGFYGAGLVYAEFTEVEFLDEIGCGEALVSRTVIWGLPTSVAYGARGGKIGGYVRCTLTDGGGGNEGPSEGGRLSEAANEDWALEGGTSGKLDLWRYNQRSVGWRVGLLPKP